MPATVLAVTLRLVALITVVRRAPIQALRRQHGLHRWVVRVPQLEPLAADALEQLSLVRLLHLPLLLRLACSVLTVGPCCALERLHALALLPLAQQNLL